MPWEALQGKTWYEWNASRARPHGTKITDEDSSTFKRWMKSESGSLWIHERVSFRAMRESKRDLKGKEKEFNSKQRLVRPVISCFFFPILGPDESWKESMSVGHWSLLCTRELYDCLSCTCEQSLSASIQQLGTAIESRKRSRINDGCPTELSLSFIGRA